MYGAILGDIIGSPYEFDMGEKTKEFPLFSPQSQFTDDSVMTLAVADALMDSTPEDENQIICERLVRSMQCFGRRYPDAGYGCMFQSWLREKDPQPYGSFGNGSAMRASAAAMISAEPVTKFVPVIITWRLARKLSRRPLPHSWRARTLRTSSAMLSLWAGTVTH